MRFSSEEIAEVVEMLHYLHLDIRAVTLSLNVTHVDDLTELVSSVERWGAKLREAINEVVEKHGVPIVTGRIALTPIQLLIKSKHTSDDVVQLAIEIDKVAKEIEIDAIGGFGAFVNVAIDESARKVISSIAEILSKTDSVFSFVNVGSTIDGMNIDAIYEISDLMLKTAEKTNGFGNAKFLVSVNLPGDVPFMPGAHHGLGRPMAEVNVAVSGPGVVEAAVRRAKVKTFRDLHEVIKKVSFKISRLGEFTAREIAKKLSIEPGSVDLSLAPTPKIGDSVARIVEAMGVPVFGAPGTLTALAILVDALKKGGSMAVSRFGGFSGLFIPLSEDAGMMEAAQRGMIDVYKLISYTAICSAGLDMVPIPFVSQETLASLIMDQLSIGIIHQKPLGVRLLPIPGAKPGDVVELGGLLGKGVVIGIEDLSPNNFVKMRGHVPPPVLRLQMG